MKVNMPKVTIKYLNINIPEFIPLSERKETDVDKSGKFINMFSQLESTLKIKLKREFVLNKLFPNDIMSDMIDIESTKQEQKVEEEDITSLFETNNNFRKNESVKFFDIVKNEFYDIVKYKLNIRIDW
jgi:hypothetical protein